MSEVFKHTHGSVVWCALEDETGLANDADAHLIAAAPEMLEVASEVAPALRRLVGGFRVGPDGEGQDIIDTLEACAADLEAAIAKAKGEYI